MALQQWSPATQLARLDHDFEEILEHFMHHDWSNRTRTVEVHHAPAIESFIEGDRLVIRADLPGVDPRSVEIAVDEDRLTIGAVRTTDTEENRRNFGHREIRYGTLARAISIPKGVRKEEIRATHRNGVLELSIPLGKESIRRVPVQMANRAAK